jgi:hypothetical protein
MMRHILTAAAVVMAGLVLGATAEARPGGGGHPGGGHPGGHPGGAHPGMGRPSGGRPGNFGNVHSGGARPGSGSFRSRPSVNSRGVHFFRGRHHNHWTRTYFDARYGCSLYYDTDDGCYYYWCQPDDCYYPVDYCPYNTYAWADE